MMHKIKIIPMILIIFICIQCNPLFLEEAPQPVKLSSLPSRQQVLSPRKAEDVTYILNQFSLQPGDNLGKSLLSVIPSRDLVNRLVNLTATEMDLRRMQPGQEIQLFTTEEGELMEMHLPRQNDIVQLVKNSSGWTINTRTRNLHKLIRYKTAVVQSSLYNAALDEDIPLAVLMEMIQLFSFEVDFQRDIFQNDYFQVAYEEILDENNQFIDTGRVVFAYLHSNGLSRTSEMFRFTDSRGVSDYYDRNGKSIRRELLKTPINGAYISSGYGMRISPILGYSKMHQGVDFAAAQGTPIYAAGSGLITSAGWSDVYGWHIRIRHANHYESMYAHMVSFGRGITRGVRVEQGKVVGYVGSTGMSTGPHCHYEVLYYGGHVNPSTVKFPPGNSLSGQDLDAFFMKRDTYLSMF